MEFVDNTGYIYFHDRHNEAYFFKVIIYYHWEKTNMFHNVSNVAKGWRYHGKTVEVEFHNFPLFHDMELKLNVELVW